MTLLAAVAAGAATAYCVYTWYASTSEDQPPRREEAEEPGINARSAPSDNVLDEGPSTSAAASQKPPSAPILIDPSGGPGAAAMDAGAHLQHHFDSIRQIADTTTLPSLLPDLSRALSTADSIEASLERLRLAKGGAVPLPQEEKQLLWQDLAGAALARLVAATWALPLLSLQVRVHLNVLGRHLYLETALQEPLGPSGVAQPMTRLSAPSQEAFLAFSEHFTKVGLVPLLAAARRAADAALAGISLGQEFNAEALGHLLSRALAIFSQDAVRDVPGGWTFYLLPTPMELRESLRLRRPDDRAMMPGAHAMLVDVDAVGAMVEEVGCILGSERFQKVALECARTVGGLEAIALAEKVKERPLPLARLVPTMVAEAKATLLPRGKCAAAVAELPDVGALCATVYSCGPPL